MEVAQVTDFDQIGFNRFKNLISMKFCKWHYLPMLNVHMVCMYFQCILVYFNVFSYFSQISALQII